MTAQIIHPNKKDVPLVYLWIYKKFCDKFGNCNQVVFSKELIEIVRRTIYQVPKKYDYYILREMEKFELIEHMNQNKHKLLGAYANKKLEKLEKYVFW